MQTLLDGSGRTLYDPASAPGAGAVAAGAPPSAPLGAPKINGEVVTSLTTCSVNLDESCRFHEVQRFRVFLDAWRHPGPDKCATAGRPPTPVTLPDGLDRQLGVNMNPICRALQ